MDSMADAPHTRRKCKTERGQTDWSELDLYMLKPSLGSGIVTHDLDYLFSAIRYVSS